MNTPLKFLEWPCPDSDGGTRTEAALAFDGGRSARLLVVPPLFEEANKMRHLAVEVLRRLDASGIDGFLPDLPGCNESLALLASQTLDAWRAGAEAAARHFGATGVLTMRGGALVRPTGIPGWDYAPLDGPKILRSMVRARVISSRESGAEESREAIEAKARSEGIALAGWQIGPQMFTDLEQATLPAQGEGVSLIEQETVGGRPLWLRAEPDFDAGQADAIATIIAVAMRQDA